MALIKRVVKGSADVSVVIHFESATTRLPETAVEHNTAGIDLWYRRDGATKVSITEAALAALDSAHSDGGIEHIGDGAYRLDLPDAAVADGVDAVEVGGTADGMIVTGGTVELYTAVPTLAQINAEVDAAIETYHLDHLLAATYDPASKPGAADALLNELIENDGGVARYTANALEQAPTGGSAPTVEEIADEVETRTIAGVTLVGTTTNLTNAPTSGDLTATMKASVNAEVDAAIETYHLDHLLATTYDPASKPGAADALLNEIVESDSGVSRFTANSLEQAPTGGSAPTVEQIRTEIDDNSTKLAAILLDTAEIANLNDLSAAEVNAEVDTALADYDAPTNTEMAAAFTEIKGATWSGTTDTLEHIRNKETDIETAVGTPLQVGTAYDWTSSEATQEVTVTEA